MDMSEQSELPRRRSHRLPQHNYRWTASYFVTIRSEHHEPVFDMPELRVIVEEGWHALPARFPHVEFDAFIVMPDHIHGILHFAVTNAKSPSLGLTVRSFFQTKNELHSLFACETTVFFIHWVIMMRHNGKQM
jgi:REP element-mobilizing transposase RayT